MICPDVHFEGVLDSGFKKTLGSDDFADPQPTIRHITKVGTKAEAASGQRKDTIHHIYLPGATYAGAAGKTQQSANSGHFGVLDSPAGAAKMAGMNVFTSDAGGK